VRLIEGEELMHHLKSLVDQYETGRPNRVQVETMTPTYLEGQIRALVGFEIEIKEIQASAKLSQNRDDENHERIVQQLEQSSLASDQEVAEEMRKRRHTSDR
jgi:transcriptional regulator